MTAHLTAGDWETGPSEWLQVDSPCVDLLLWEGRDLSDPDGRASFWVYWRSDDALPWDQVTIADSFGEFGWATPADASVMDPDRISVATEWIEVVRYERWPAPGPSVEPGEPAMTSADGFALVARTTDPSGFLGVGSVILGDRAESNHDPRRLLETLELDMQVLLGSCG